MSNNTLVGFVIACKLIVFFGIVNLLVLISRRSCLSPQANKRLDISGLSFFLARLFLILSSGRGLVGRSTREFYRQSH